MGEIEEVEEWIELPYPMETISPFVLSVDGMMVNEYQVIFTTLSRLVAIKMDEPIFHIKGWLNVRTVIAVARSYSYVLCGACVLSLLRTQYLDWGLVSGLGLAQYANIVLCTPAQTHPFNSNPTIRFAQRALRVQHNPPPQRPYGTTPTSTKTDGKFGIKIRQFGVGHGDIGLL